MDKKRLLHLFGLVLFIISRWKIRLIWDSESRHFYEMVQYNFSELNTTLSGITPGCTSLIQICDLIAKKSIRKEFNNQYVSWKIRSDPGPGENSRSSDKTFYRGLKKHWKKWKRKCWHIHRFQDILVHMDKFPLWGSVWVDWIFGKACG